MRRPRVTVGAHCEADTLVIPEQLGGFADAHLLMADQDSSIFYKDLERDLRGVEFYTSRPCLTYILEGRETFTSFDSFDVELGAAELLLMPREMFLVSDFVSAEGPLRSFLFFFGDTVLDEFLLNTEPSGTTGLGADRPLKIAPSVPVRQYMNALRLVYRPSPRPNPAARIKLLELLYLLHEQDRSGALRATIATAHLHTRKRNIAQIMARHALRNLKVEDYAALSGRSLSTFTREFRGIYGMSPKRWLIEARLAHAKELVTGSDLRISEIAFTIGYENASHFIKAFKLRFGETPKRMRQARNAACGLHAPLLPQAAD
ncbi:MAG: AraC family transcriptional regulator [Pseudomonadota bacterium]